jgi:acyl-CoA synthetase (AMP-forming)/AMP-acid ligase II
VDAKLLISHDLSSGSVGGTQDSVQFITNRWKEDRTLTYHFLEEHATGKNADNVFIIFEDRSWTYKQYFEDLHRVGNWLMNDLGIKKRELVALDGGNSPEYLLIWMAIESIGACPSFTNCNLTAAPLVHCITLSGARYLLADRDTQNLVQPCELELLKSNIQTLYYDSAFVSTLKDVTPVPQSRRSGFKPGEPLSLIYTSGTTGMPKGTIMVRSRELSTAYGVSRYLGLKPGIKMYTCLPLYHGAAHGLCITPTLYAGSTVVLSRKFSHKTFWPEIRKSKPDILQYVGELCRYLVNAPPSPLDKQHSLKMAWGNGMRPDVWEVFRQRFGVEIINELYAATDGMGASFNANRGDFGKGAIGVRGWYWNWVNGDTQKRVKIDVVTEELQRDKNGFAKECKAGEPGETLHKLDPATADTVFAGYFNNKGAGEKRKIRDVFRRGDLWFRSGDVMRQDVDGCLYFVDRLGDTFRWKSENVSTNEVGDVLGKFHQIAETNVYGVQVPHTDGRAGCAAITLVDGLTIDSFDFEGLAKHAIGILPRYAVPIFLRIVSELEKTGTMKLQKGKLRAEGIDLDRMQESNIQDRLYWLPPGQHNYLRFEKKEWEELKARNVNL